MPYRTHPFFVSAALLVCALISRQAQARELLLAAPAGGQSIILPGQKILCPTDAELSGWKAEAGSRRITPPAEPTGKIALRMAGSLAGCSDAEAFGIIAVPFWPELVSDQMVVDADSGRLDVVGKNLKNTELSWVVGERFGNDVCHDPEAVGANEKCGFAIPNDFPADTGQISVTVLPEGVHAGGEVLAFDAKGRRMGLAGLTRQPARVIVREFLAPETTLDAESDEARIPLRHKEAIAQVSCLDAVCEWNGREVLVRALRGNEEALEVRVALRPHISFQGSKEQSSVSAFWVPLQRCPLSLASAPPLRGVGSQKIVLKAGGRCVEDEGLKFFVNGSPANVSDRQSIGDSRYLVLGVDTSLGDEVSITWQRRSRVVALVRAKTRQMPNVHARLELAGHGAIDFLPTNREADLLLPPIGEGSVLVPLPVVGVYTVNVPSHGVAKVRGVLGATGWVALRFAVRDSGLPGALAQLNLLSFSETVDRAIHGASIPLSLGASALSDKPIVELLCSDVQGEAYPIAPAKPVSLPYAVKDTCRLVLHRERLIEEEGEQLLRITVNVAALDGTNRPEAAIDQRIKLSPGKEPRVLYLGGVAAPFDRVVARATVVTEDLAEAVLTERFTERLSLPQIQWSMIIGNSKLRLFATTAMPTGLFRVADTNHSGLIGLSAGILARLVWLTREGVQAPVGIEGGVLLLGIAGDTTNAPHGQFAVVLGLSLGVPIANVSRSTQAAISLHAWAEYEVSRTYINSPGRGSPWGFIFGPSLSFGDVGVNL